MVGSEDAWIRRWIYEFMNKRRIRVMVNRCEMEEKIVRCTTPQGSLLSPILFVIYLWEALEDSTINYMDDCTDIREWRQEVVEEIIRIKKEKFRRIGIAIDGTKTEAYIFRKKKKIQGEKTLEETKKNIMYLRMKMNEKLNWKDYIKF